MRVLLALSMLAAAAPVSADIYEVSLQGVLTRQIYAGGASPFSVGSIFRMSARFDDRSFAQTAAGYYAAGFYGLPTAGEYFFKIQSEGLTWESLNDKIGRETFYTYDYAPDDGERLYKELQFPGIIFDDDRVLGFQARLVPPGSTPSLYNDSRIGSGGEACYNETPESPLTCSSGWTAGNYDRPRFEIRAEFIYSNVYDGAGFEGEWDFANSTVRAVPEPASWLMLIIGFALTGALMRRRPSVCWAGQAPKRSDFGPNPMTNLGTPVRI